MRKLKVLDLFSGIGGFSLGLERAGGFETVAFCEIDPFCRAVLKKHWPSVRQFDDVRTLCKRVYDCEPENDDGEVICRIHGEEFGDCDCIGTDQFIDEVGGIDLVCGGFPCQDISNARTAQGDPLGLDGERSGLWVEFARIVGELGPRFVIVENAAELTVRGLLAILGDLTERGYDAQWFTFPASAIGAPHRRGRTFIVANPNSEGLQRAILEKLEREIKGRHDAHSSGSTWIHAASGVLRSADGVSSRMDRLRAIGNSVVPQIPEVIGKAIMRAEGML